ncbi:MULTISPECIES: hypothetical protein [Rhizobium]|uniref:Uncharacterized protein n=1 Tax=Rhizobium paranaense TaxID=1650438 RepID=A0A7W8XXD9_9HYPH|nr:hypothetical protein [Rhizobium paranaense]
MADSIPRKRALARFQCDEHVHDILGRLACEHPAHLHTFDRAGQFFACHYQNKARSYLLLFHIAGAVQAREQPFRDRFTKPLIDMAGKEVGHSLQKIAPGKKLIIAAFEAVKGIV